MMIIVGDINVDVSKTCHAKKITNIANNPCMQQLIKDYTRIATTSRTIIDLIFLSKPDVIKTA